ncbi:unnamed protein product [Gongylonema pulchrum]|uniref:RUN domain-containing protein n=1 Tax=Gongylonema pulchrum TaxID=637853 RepID=A0A183DX46_9BILA|nr:unnamed protein product [Gongylonema pulchrum]
MRLIRILQGGTIKQLVRFLKVKQNEVHKKTVFEMVGENVFNNMMAAVEGIAGYRGQYWHYVKPYLMSNAKSGADRLVDYHEHIQVKEAVRHLKVHGSFVGLATTQSKANLQQMEASHLVSDNAYVESGLTGDTLKPNDTNAKMPRNESISVFLREKFDQLNSPVSFGVYSRHLLDVDNTPRAVFRRQDALHFKELSSFIEAKPRFLITSEADSDTPPSAPRHLTRMTAEPDSQEMHEPDSVKWSFSNVLPPGDADIGK